MSGDRGNERRGSGYYGWAIAGVGIGALSIWRFIAMLSRDQVDAFTLAVGVLGTLVILVVILAIPAARSRNRIRFLRRTNPGSVVLTVTV